MVSKLPWYKKETVGSGRHLCMNANQCLMLLGSYHFPRLHLVKPLETRVLLMFLADAPKQNMFYLSLMHPGIFRRILLDENFELPGVGVTGHRIIYEKPM